MSAPRSRLTMAAPAVRPALHARAILSGPPGAGKTRSALIIAQTLGGKILMVDTEKESALTYADDFEFDHLRWAPPFDPRELGRMLIEAGQNYDVVIVDSLSHFWRGEGGGNRRAFAHRFVGLP
ncbi:ATP-binding protein, partial [bacterium]|nr:ATP-binding protein [bacterium]